LRPPPYLDEEFRARCGSVAIDLARWYAETLVAIGDQPLLQSVRNFWKAAFERDIVPQLEHAGGVSIQREAPLTRAEIAEATRIRRSIGHCPHPSDCDTFDACVAQIGWDRRQKIAGVRRGRA
jgi:hypothetical protein